MALLNGLYLFAKDEQVTRDIETAAHPVETGIDITDHVKRKPVEIKLEGEIVGESADDILGQIVQMNQTGVVITYVGLNYFKNGQIVGFTTKDSNEIWGGHAFDMTIREVRFAQSSYDPLAEAGDTAAGRAAQSHRPVQAVQQGGMQQRTHGSTSASVAHTTKNGETARTIAQEYKQQGADTESVNAALSGFGSRSSRSVYIPPGQKINVGTRKGA